MLAGRTILVVEDDAETRAMLTHRLGEDFGVPVAAAGTLQEAETLLSDENVCIGAMILDVGMPDGDGSDFCARMRREGHKMPIIVLTASDGEEDIIRGLEAGANDYIAKPFRTNELLARLRAQLRGFESSVDAAFPVGPYIFHPAKKLLQHSDHQEAYLADREGSGNTEIPLSGACSLCGPQKALARGLGIQFRRRHSHLGDAHLSIARQNRGGPSKAPIAHH